MQRHAVRDPLALVGAAAVAVALGITSLPGPQSADTKRLVEISTVRLQAEVTTVAAGFTGMAAPERVKRAAPAAATASSAVGSAVGSWTYNPSYSFVDNIVYNLPPKIRAIVIPPLYAAAWVVGAVMAVPMLIITPIIKWFKPTAASTRAVATALAPAPAPPSAAAVASPPDPVTRRAARTARAGSSHSRVLAPPPAAAAVGHFPTRAQTPVSEARAATRSVR